MDQNQINPSGFLMDFDPAHRVLRVRPHGVITNDILIAADVAVRQFLAAEGADFGLYDYSAVSDLQVTTENVRDFAGKEPPAATIRMKLRIAIAPQPFVYGMNRMYETLLESKRTDFAVVRTMAEAEAMLGLGTLIFSRALSRLLSPPSGFCRSSDRNE